jgi:DNA topoisomerase-1
MENSNKKSLIIVESPTKARTIKKFLPKNYTVLASNGHVRDLPSKDLSIDVEKGYIPKYVISKGKDKIIKELKSELAKSDNLLLATDEDREGESIAHHLVEILKPKVPYERMVFHEITKSAILNALENGRPIRDNLVNAQEARRVLDRLYGYTLSPFLWRKLSLQKLSAGRVQSPGLRMVVERERQRIDFVSAQYWDLKADLLKGVSFEAQLTNVGNKKVATGKDFNSETGKLKNPSKVVCLKEEEAKELKERLIKGAWKVVSVEEKERKQRPSPPFITSTLQQEGSRKLRLSAKETMRIAQKLYENGFITYMRTDSPSLSQEGIKAARVAAEKLFGENFLSPTSRQYTSKSSSAQEAHEAIRPAGNSFIHPDDTNLSGKERDLYDLIWKRTLASQMADAIKASTTAKIEVGDAIFTANGNIIKFAGFIRVYVEGIDDPEAALEDKEKILPPLASGDQLKLNELFVEMHETKPPARYTEATLVQELEKQGIGRPSTYATIIDKLFEKEYVIKDGTALVPSFVGFAVTQLLEKNFDTLVDYEFTSKMEGGLDLIAEGKVDRLDFLKSFYEGDEGLLSQVESKLESVKGIDAKHIELNSVKEPYKIMIGKFGPYVTKDDVTATIPNTLFPGTVTKDDLEMLLSSKNGDNGVAEPIGVDPKTKLPIYLLVGRYGPYYQLGLKDDDNPKPKRASVPKKVDPETLDLETISNLLHLPREIGLDPATNKSVVASIGPYGPYVGSDGKFASIKELNKLFSIELDEALELLAASKAAKSKKGRKSEPIISFGEHEGKALAVYYGRYGYYGKLGGKNFPLPNEMKKDEEALKELTKEKMVELFLAAKKS